MASAALPVVCTVDAPSSLDRPADAAEDAPTEPGPVTEPPAEASELPWPPPPETLALECVSVEAFSPVADALEVDSAPSEVEPPEVLACAPAEDDALAAPPPDALAEAEVEAEAETPPLSSALASALASPDADVPPSSC
jgi:hypothetical protein